MDSASQFMPPRPPSFNMNDKTSKFYQEVLAVKNAGDSLTDEQKHIAMFWDDLGSKTIVNGHVMFTAKVLSNRPLDEYSWNSSRKSKDRF